MLIVIPCAHPLIGTSFPAPTHGVPEEPIREFDQLNVEHIYMKSIFFLHQTDISRIEGSSLISCHSTRRMLSQQQQIS